MNTNLVLVSGKTSTGKSACFRNMEDKAGVVYLNCENNKALPFPKGDMQVFTIADPHQVPGTLTEIEAMPEVHTVIVDSATFLMDMYETMYVNDAANTQKAWGDYAKFFKKLMNEQVNNSSKRIVFTGHTTEMPINEYLSETRVKVKGSLNDRGIEAFFSTVISTKRMLVKDLADYENDMLNITEEEEILGYKYVFQTRLTKKTSTEAIRAGIGMWDVSETFIDNDIQHVFKRLEEFYG